MAQVIPEFERGAKRARIATRILMVIGLVLSAAALWWGLGEAEVSADRGIAKVVAMTSLAIVALLVGLAMSFRKHKGMAALQDPANLASYQVIEQYGTVRGLSVRTKDGKVHNLNFISTIAGEADRAIEGLKKLAPHIEQESPSTG